MYRPGIDPPMSLVDPLRTMGKVTELQIRFRDHVTQEAVLTDGQALFWKLGLHLSKALVLCGQRGDCVKETSHHFMRVLTF